MALPTSSFRAPAEFHTLIHEIARALRRRPDLAEPLRALLATVEDSDTPVDTLPSWLDLVRRLAEVERQVAEHGALHAMHGAVQAVPAEEPKAPVESAPKGTAAKSAPRPAPAEPMTTGEGRMKRLTAAGLAELDRRLRAGEPEAAIAAALGVSTNTVGRRRAAGGWR